MTQRVVKKTILEGCFSYPIGITFMSRGFGEWPKTVEVSTVNLEGGHLEDPIEICEPEHGYETMVFLDGCSFFSVHTAQYRTKRAAAAGHDQIVAAIIAGVLPLSIPLTYLGARERSEQVA